MQADIADILIDRQTIADRLDELAAAISEDLPHDGEGMEITLVPIMTGSIIFVADLIRRLPQRMQIHLLSASSYAGTATTSSGEVKVDDALSRLPESLAGRNVLVLDDILDSGNTLRRITGMLAERQPATLRTCVLLRKTIPSAMSFDVDYVGFDIPDAFVVGYGLDYDDYYRNLPEIVTLKPEVIRG